MFKVQKVSFPSTISQGRGTSNQCGSESVLSEESYKTAARPMIDVARSISEGSEVSSTRYVHEPPDRFSRNREEVMIGIEFPEYGEHLGGEFQVFHFFAADYHIGVVFARFQAVDTSLEELDVG